MLDIEKIERKAKLNGGLDAFANEDGGGLTKREWFAGMALQGLVAGTLHRHGCAAYDRRSIAKTAVETADALLKQLAESDGAK
jgi:hypothetical protein